MHHYSCECQIRGTAGERGRGRRSKTSEPEPARDTHPLAHLSSLTSLFHCGRPREEDQRAVRRPPFRPDGCCASTAVFEADTEPRCARQMRLRARRTYTMTELRLSSASACAEPRCACELCLRARRTNTMPNLRLLSVRVFAEPRCAHQLRLRARRTSMMTNLRLLSAISCASLASAISARRLCPSQAKPVRYLHCVMKDLKPASSASSFTRAEVDSLPQLQTREMPETSYENGSLRFHPPDRHGAPFLE